MIPRNPDLPPIVRLPWPDPFIYLPKRPRPRRLGYRLKRRAAGAKRRNKGKR